MRGKNFDQFSPDARFQQDDQGSDFVSEYDFSSQEIGDNVKRNLGEVYVQNFDLSVAQDAPIEINTPGRGFVVYGFTTASAVKTREQDILVNVNINTQEGKPFPAKHDRGFVGTFQKLFLTWPAQAGKSFTLVVHKSWRIPWQLDGFETQSVVTGVTSLNSLTGAINFLAGTNITLTTVGQNITISASGGGGSVAIGSPVSGGTANSVLYIDLSGNLAQDNGAFVWKDANKTQLLNRGTTDDGSGATLQIAASATALNTASNVVVTFQPNSTSPYLIANGTNWGFTIYDYYTIGGITYYDAVGSSGSTQDPNDGQGYDPVINWSPAVLSSGYIVYDQVNNKWLDNGPGSSAMLITTDMFTPGTPPLTPSNYPGGVGLSVVGTGTNSIGGNLTVTGNITSSSTSGTNLFDAPLNVPNGNSTIRQLTVSTGLVSSSTTTFANTTTWGNAVNMAFQTTTGTKIGTATGQKIGFWNATPVIQQTTAVAAATFVAGAGTPVTDTSTFDGYTLKQIVKALRNMGLLA